jgi:hypothetical protein
MAHVYSRYLLAQMRESSLDVLAHVNVYTIVRDSIVASIPACHAGDPGSIPGRGALFS